MSAPLGVLVLDDDGSIRELLVDLLADEGYMVYPCATTAEAEQLLAEVAPALLLVDERLGPERGSDWLARRRRAGGALPPAVVMSAAPLDPCARAEAAVADVLAKPFEVDALLSCLARHYPRPAPAASADGRPPEALQAGGRGLTAPLDLAGAADLRPLQPAPRRRQGRAPRAGRASPRRWGRCRAAGRRGRRRRRAGPCAAGARPWARARPAPPAARDDALGEHLARLRAASLAEHARGAELRGAARGLIARAEEAQRALAAELARARALVHEALALSGGGRGQPPA